MPTCALAQAERGARARAGQPSHQTAIDNLYLLGAAEWPGHGVNGGSGCIVAKELLARSR